MHCGKRAFLLMFLVIEAHDEFGPAYIKARLHIENNTWSPLYTGAALSTEQKYVRSYRHVICQ